MNLQPESPNLAQPEVEVRIKFTNPRWTTYLIVVLIIVYGVEEVTGGSRNVRALVNLGANYFVLVQNGQYWRLLTANLLHSGLYHITVNIGSLYIFGREVESVFGSPRYLAICLLTGISGQLFSYIFNPGIAVGASTFIFGLIGAFAAYFARNFYLLKRVSAQNLIQLMLVVTFSMVSASQPDSNVDIWGHIGGMLGGVFLGLFFSPRYQPRALNGEFLGADSIPQSIELVDTNSLRQQTKVIIGFLLAMVAMYFASQANIFK